LAPRQGLIVRGSRPFQIAGLDPALYAARIDFHGETNSVVHRGGQWLRTTHAAQSAGENYAAAQRSLKLASGYCAKCLVRPLEDALSPDVDPRTRRHLTIHDQPATREGAQYLPRREPAYEICVVDQHARRVAVLAEN